MEDENPFHPQRRSINKNIIDAGQENNCDLVSGTDIPGTVLIRS